MEITYYATTPFGGSLIFEFSVDTESKEYVSHTDDSVTIRDSYVDEYLNTRYLDVIHSRNFNALRIRMINDFKKRTPWYW